MILEPRLDLVLGQPAQARTLSHLLGSRMLVERKHLRQHLHLRLGEFRCVLMRRRSLAALHASRILQQRLQASDSLRRQGHVKHVLFLVSCLDDRDLVHLLGSGRLIGLSRRASQNAAGIKTID